MKHTTSLRFAILTVIALCCLPLLAQRGEGELNPAPPKGLTVDQIIQQFSAKELEFAKARESYTWHQSMKVDELDGDTVEGTRQMDSDILFDDQGKRVDHVTYAPQDTLQKIQWTREDDDDLRHRMPFTVTADT